MRVQNNNINMIMYCAMFVSLILSLIMGSGCVEAVRININPDIAVTSAGRVNITCTTASLGPADGQTNSTKRVTMMTISKYNEPSLATLRDCWDVSYGEAATSDMEAVGSIEEDYEKSSLSLTLLDPKPQDSGVYTCSLYYIDEIGHLQQETQTWTLSVQNLDAQGMMTTVSKLQQRVAKLETLQLDQASTSNAGIEDRMAALETQTSKLVETASHISAFSVTTNKTVIPTRKNQRLILPDVIMQEGPRAYDRNTGVFTVPYDGLYAFHVVAFGSPNCYNYLELRAKGEAVARLNTFNKFHWDQSSMSSVVELRTGNRVYIRMLRDYCKVHREMYTVFTGYLVKAY